MFPPKSDAPLFCKVSSAVLKCASSGAAQLKEIILYGQLRALVLVQLFIGATQA